MKEEEEEDPTEIGEDIVHGGCPMRDKQLDQFDEDTVSEGKEDPPKISGFNPPAKGEGEEEGGDKVSDKVNDLIPAFAQIYPTLWC